MSNLSAVFGDDYFKNVIDPGDRASKFAKEICFRSHGNSDLVHIVAHQPNNFRGPVSFAWRKDILARMQNYREFEGRVVDWELAEAVEDDGAGGKPQFVTFLGEEAAFRGHGWEIIAMTKDDFARSGRLGVVIDNEFNAKRITDQNFHLFQALMEGLGDALAKSYLVNITGEVAVMKHSVTAFCDTNSDNQLVFTWGASCVGLSAKDKLIDGTRVTHGMTVIGLHEQGYRCNGGTFFTNLILNKWGDNVQAAMDDPDTRTFVRKLTAPSISYARFIEELVGWHGIRWGGKVSPDIRAVAHITGGGVWGKFQEALPEGVGANLDTMPEPPAVLREAQEMSQDTPYKLSDWQAYGTLHGGCGMLLVCTSDSASTILDHAKSCGIVASRVGETTRSEKREVLIKSRFLTDKVLSSERRE